MKQRIIHKVSDYYTNKIIEFGPTSQGVDWNGPASHGIRFQQLTKLIQDKDTFSILDYGCGYGSYIDFLEDNKYTNFKYFGYDISEEMIAQAKLKFKDRKTHFSVSLPKSQYDYVIANGIFNVKLDEEYNVWQTYVENTLKTINEVSSKGFSFNILTSFSDDSHKKDYLFYANPMYFFEFCKKHFSKNVALLHDYELYEFTIIVRK